MTVQQLYIDGSLADTNENTDVTLTLVSNLLKGAADFSGNRSLTITLPSTLHNQVLIGHADKVPSVGTVPYTFHTIDYYRNGVQVIKGGVGRVMGTTPTEIEIAVTWGVRVAVDALLNTDETLNDITTNAAITFNATPVCSTYADAQSNDVFYAALDCVKHISDNEFFTMHVGITGRSWDNSNAAAASSYLHPSVRMDWLLSQMYSKWGASINWGTAAAEFPTMIVPLISKIPNDTTYNGGYKANIAAPSGNNWLRFTTSNASAIIEAQTTPPEVLLTCATAFSGMVRFSIHLYIDDFTSMSPFLLPTYGYRVQVLYGGETSECDVITEDTAIYADELDSNGRLYMTLSGKLPVEMEVADTLRMRIGSISGGIFDGDTATGMTIYSGVLWINEIIGSENEVQPTQQYPVEGNIPAIKPMDLVKFLCAVTGTFPLQSSTSSAIIMASVSSVFDWDNAVDWSGRLLSPTDRSVAAKNEYTIEGWAQKNWFRWKDDDTVSGDYDGSIDVSNETLEQERDIFTFPFAATDGNNVPMYINDDGETKWEKCEPRVLTLTEDSNSMAVGVFDMGMGNIIANKYAYIAATMAHPVVITETVRLNDREFAAIDESKAIYLSQHGAYFALLELTMSSDGTAEVKLLKLTKE